MAAPQTPGYGQFTGYEPMPGGGYNFKLATGASVPFAGAPAEELRKQIDAAKGASIAAPAYTPGAGPMAAPPAQPPAGFNPLVTTKGGGVLGEQGGNFTVREAPRAATKGGMAARGMTTQGGYEVDEQYLQQKEASDLRVQAIHEQALQKGTEIAAERSGMMKAMQAQAEKDLAAQAKDNAEKERRLGEYQAKLDKAEQAYTGFHDEKEREANSPKAKLTTFVHTLSSALGALGASMARTPNFAAEAVARHNEMQLRREEAELRVRKDTKDSLLGQLQQQMGSLDLAKSAYRAIQAKQAALVYETIAQKEKDVDRQKSDLMTAEILHQNSLGHRESYIRNSAGEVTRTFQYVPGSAGSRGGNRAPTVEELQSLANLRKTQAETDKTLRPDGGKFEELGQPRQEAIGGFVSTIQAANSIETNLRGRKLDEKSTLDDPVSGGVDRAREFVSSVVGEGKLAQENEALRANTQLLAKGMQSAFGKSDRDAQDAEAMATGSGSASARIRSATSARTRAAQSLKAQLNNMTPEQRQRTLEQLPPDVIQSLRQP